MVKLKSSGAGKAVSVYLNARAITLLESEIEYGQKSSRDLTVARLVAMCVDYVIDKGDLKYVSSYVKRARAGFFDFILIHNSSNLSLR